MNICRTWHFFIIIMRFYNFYLDAIHFQQPLPPLYWKPIRGAGLFLTIQKIWRDWTTTRVKPKKYTKTHPKVVLVICRTVYDSTKGFRKAFAWQVFRAGAKNTSFSAAQPAIVIAGRLGKSWPFLGIDQHGGSKALQGPKVMGSHWRWFMVLDHIKID